MVVTLYCFLPNIQFTNVRHLWWFMVNSQLQKRKFPFRILKSKLNHPLFLLIIKYQDNVLQVITSSNFFFTKIQQWNVVAPNNLIWTKRGLVIISLDCFRRSEMLSSDIQPSILISYFNETWDNEVTKRLLKTSDIFEIFIFGTKVGWNLFFWTSRWNELSWSRCTCQSKKTVGQGEYHSNLPVTYFVYRVIQIPL